MNSEHEYSIDQLFRYYWLRANLMRVQFYRALKENPTQDLDVDQQTYMNLWYASLYSVVEGYKKLDLDNLEVNQLLASPNLEALRKFRHSVTEFHKRYFNQSLISPLVTSSGSVLWINNLHFSLEKYLKEETQL